MLALRSEQVRYWKTNLELVKSMGAHREAVRMLAFAPSDLKYATGSDDTKIRVGGVGQSMMFGVLRAAVSG